MLKRILSAAKSIALPLLVGLLAALLVGDNFELYDVLIKPPFALPGNLFALFWTLLYLLMGVSLFLFKRSTESEKAKNDGILFFYTQLFLNFLWPIVFFNFELPFTAFILLIALFIFTAITTMIFYQSNRISGILLLPYLAYIIYAGYLNFAIWFLNL